MNLFKKAKNFYQKEKHLYNSFDEIPTIGKKVYKFGKNAGTKISRIAKKPKYKKIKKRAIGLRNNIDYYFSN